MKIILKDKRRFVLRFDKGEEVMAGLVEFMIGQNISGFAFNAIGACSFAELGYYNTEIKGYSKQEFKENMEVVSILGNGSLKDGQPVIHAHGTFSKTDYSTVGGHIFKLVISATCEVFAIQLDGGLGRNFDAEMNMNRLA